MMAVVKAETLRRIEMKKKVGELAIGTAFDLSKNFVETRVLDFKPEGPFEVLDHDIDGTTVIAGQDGRSFKISSKKLATLN
jgi:hypothetical protein